MTNVDCFWLDVGFLIGSSAKTAFSREAATAGASALITYGRENHTELQSAAKKGGFAGDVSTKVRIKMNSSTCTMTAGIV